ncbi:hypothetical protein PLEOSDRAFT_22419 [Pleurotus ostreatus PC15]|uniref:Prolyl 4-hydroxylase alpha subunit Fe(2+) 2OG dioxygenase domain-containing protein n=1 Tax=Pleurotus ostreatus (strain PC15) TaxID=1137138 RepID=A0A067NYN6_PLEO1|nr:hypothetical protein PLEOSDRAFT_22419 [Pleurotus ostreatus PC15]
MADSETYRQLDLRDPEDAQVQLLVKLCGPATFGRNQEDLLDETYSKAGKMDIENFSMNIDFGQLQISEKIGSELLVDGRPFRWELYKLNVYGPGSFFKVHKDTPRSEAMFGSLVLVLPISRKGGELLLRTKEEVYMKSFRLNLATGSPSHTTSSSLQSHPPWYRLQHPLCIPSRLHWLAF